jgi:predicted kinase
MLVLLRGLPGAGKSYTAVNLFTGSFHIEADMYMHDGQGRYLFDPAKLAFCHQQCQRETEDALKEGQNVVVANTFTTVQEMKPYLEMAWSMGIPVKVISLFDGGMTDYELYVSNLHHVPLATLARMRARWEPWQGEFHMRRKLVA